MGFAVGGSGDAHAFVNDGKNATEIIYPGSPSTYALDVNSLGEILIGALGETFVYRSRSFTPVTIAGGHDVQGRGINDRGQVVGNYTNDLTGVLTAFVWDRGAVTTVANPGADATVALAVNNRGQVVGEYYLNGVPHAYVATKAGL